MKAGGRSMGAFFHPIKLTGPGGSETLEGLVDTSILFAIIPSPVLRRIGVKRDRTVRVGPTKRRRGLTQAEALEAVAKAELPSEASVEDKVRLALQYFARG